MNYYRMDRQMPGNGAIIFRRSHKLIPFKTGASFGDGFEEPLITELDKELHNGVLPTFFTSPGFIVKIDFYNDLKKIGIDNLEVYKTVIKDPIDGKTIENYLFLNIIGRVSCANMDESEYETIDEDMHIIDDLVIDSKKLMDWIFFWFMKIRIVLLSVKEYTFT